MYIIKGDDFRRLMKKGLSGGFLFFGDEDYLKLHTLYAAREAVCPDEGFALFNDMRLDNTTFSGAALLDALTPLPMMSDKKIVSVSGLDLTTMRQKELEELYEVLESLEEYDYNVLIISLSAEGIEEGYLPKSPSKMLKKLSQYITPVHFEPATPAKLVAWCQKHFYHNGIECDDFVCRKLIERCASSMFTLSSEIDKLSFYLLEHGRKNVTEADIENVCCITLEDNAFALTNALLAGRNDFALAALAVMKFNRVDPLHIFSEISTVIGNLLMTKALVSRGASLDDVITAISRPQKRASEYTAKNYISAVSKTSRERLERALLLCAETDTALKLSAKAYTEIEKLICAI